VERLWTNVADGMRLNLHRIHPCVKALLHPHPWPSAVVIGDGIYEMETGYSSSDTASPVIVATMLLSAGSGYEMIHPHGWHSVRPIGGPSLSVMLTGKPWETPGLSHPGKDVKHPSLTQIALRDLLYAFRVLYPRIKG
jgi:hypothetical protein